MLYRGAKRKPYEGWKVKTGWSQSKMMGIKTSTKDQETWPLNSRLCRSAITRRRNWWVALKNLTEMKNHRGWTTTHQGGRNRLATKIFAIAALLLDDSLISLISTYHIHECIPEMPLVTCSSAIKSVDYDARRKGGKIDVQTARLCGIQLGSYAIGKDLFQPVFSIMVEEEKKAINRKKKIHLL
jgi:hypothetical protein